MELDIKHHKGNEGRFFIEENGKVLGFLEYSIEGKRLIILHTEVSDELKGTGSARKLVDKAVEYGHASGMEVSASCGYAGHILDRYYGQV